MVSSSTKNFKVSHGGAFLRFSLTFTENEENPLEKIKEALRERGVPLEQSSLFWLDEEQSKVYLRTSLDWKDCLQANSGDLLRLLVVPEREGSVEVVYENNNNGEAIVEEPRGRRARYGVSGVRVRNDGPIVLEPVSRRRTSSRSPVRTFRPYRATPERDTSRSRSRSRERRNGVARITTYSALNPGRSYQVLTGSSTGPSTEPPRCSYMMPGSKPYRYC